MEQKKTHVEEFETLPEKYKARWQEFEEKEKEYKSLESSIPASKRDQIAGELYRFVDTKLRDKYFDLNDLVRNIEGKGQRYQFLRLLDGIQQVEDFSKIVDLAIEVKKSGVPVKDIPERIRQLSDEAFGHKEIGWGSFKLGTAGVLILGAIAGIIAVGILINPFALLFVAAVVGAAALYYMIVDPKPLSDFYKKDLSKDLEALAEQIQGIVGKPQVELTPVVQPNPASFEGVYTKPEPDQPSESPTSQPPFNPNPNPNSNSKE